MMKSHSPKKTPNMATYRKYTSFDIDKFIDKLFLSYVMFKIISEKHAPLKKKYLRSNHSKFFIKEIIKAIMLRSK